MGTSFSIVYPTRHRPEFLQQALRILESQGHDQFEVIVSDNYVDPALSCEQVCRESVLANLRYVRPPQPLGMVENWNHALPFATGDYVSFLTDKMFVLPDALGRIERAIELAGGPDVVSWTGDAYNPGSYADYFGDGVYVSQASEVGSDQLYQPFSPSGELDRRGAGEVARGEQTPSEYSRGKLVFGAYRRGLVEQIAARHGALFHNINPDYTSMVLGLSAADSAIELGSSCVVSINTEISNGMLCDTNDAAALAFLDSLAGGARSILPDMLVPGLYASLHNWVAHDYLLLKRDFGLSFQFDTANWLVYCTEDIDRPERQWSAPRVEEGQKALLQGFVESLEPAVAAAVQSRIAARARRARNPLWRRISRRVVPRPSRPDPLPFPSIQAAVAHWATGRS